MKEVLYRSVNNFRYERKFYIEDSFIDDIEMVLRLHPLLFSEIYYERTVNNIYLDTPELINYFDNVNGVSKRIKVRIRWYGEKYGAVKEPVLECKLKHNLHVGKLSYNIKPFRLDERFNVDTLRGSLKDSSAPQSLMPYISALEPVFLSSYRRKYFLSSDGEYRITVDRNMEVCALNPYGNSFLGSNVNTSDIIVEIKYNKSGEEKAGKVTEHFPFRMTRSSKYVAGVTETYY